MTEEVELSEHVLCEICSNATFPIPNDERCPNSAYKPKPGMAAELENLMKAHAPLLRSQGLATERESIIMRAKDGTIIEVFEWMSKEAIDSAHQNAAVLEMWQYYADVCDYIPISHVRESDQLFAEFTPMAST